MPLPRRKGILRAVCHGTKALREEKRSHRCCSSLRCAAASALFEAEVPAGPRWCFAELFLPSQRPRLQSLPVFVRRSPARGSCVFFFGVVLPRFVATLVAPRVPACSVRQEQRRQSKAAESGVPCCPSQCYQSWGRVEVAVVRVRLERVLPPPPFLLALHFCRRPLASLLACVFLG